MGLSDNRSDEKVFLWNLAAFCAGSALVAICNRSVPVQQLLAAQYQPMTL